MEYREFLAAEDKQFRAHLEEHQRVIGGLLEELKAQGERISQEAAQAVKASGKEAVSHAQASLGQVGQAAQKIGEMAQQASDATAKAAKQSEDLLGRLDQASQRMVTSEQKVETALDELVPKVVGVRKELEKELGDVVNAAAATEAEIKRVVTGIRTSLTKEAEEEIRTKLGKAADLAAHRIYSLGAWWENFHRIGIYAALAFGMAATGFLGWWYGRHQIEEGTYEKALVEVQKNAEVLAYAYQFEKQRDGTYEPKSVVLDAPLACTVPGKFMYMTRNERGQWVYGQAVVEPGRLASALLWDSSNKDKWKVVKANRP
jgi:hypothetical protein